MNKSTTVPAGYRFHPFEHELICSYLKPKVLGQKLPCNVVEERQLYGPDASPWQVFDPEKHPWILSEVTPGKFEKLAYVFVNLTKKAAVERKNKVRRDNYMKKAGCGTWDGQTKRYEIRDWDGNIIGEKRFLVFEINNACDLDLSKVGYWKMHEYHLCGINKDISNPSNIVLCKITLDYFKSPPVKLRFNILRDNINQEDLVKSSSKPQKKNTNVDSVSSSSTEYNSGIVPGDQGVLEATSTQIRREDLVVSNTYRDRGEEGQSGEDTTTNLTKREHIVGTSCVETKKLKPVSSNFIHFL